MADQTDNGVIDAVDRVLAQLLESPAFKNSIRIMLSNIDPQSARRLVRTVMWRDMDFSLSCAAAPPALINSLVSLVDEALDQINDKFPERMLTEYTADVIEDIDREAIDRIREKGRALYGTLAPVIEEALSGRCAESDKCTTPEVRKSVGKFGADAAGPDETADERNACPDAESVLEEVLRTPFLKDILREVLSGIDPEKGARTVRTLMWEDPETMLALLGAVPAIVNFHIHAAAELGCQLNDKMPPQLLVPFVAGLFADIDTQTARKGMAAYKELAQAVIREADPGLQSGFHDMLSSPGLARSLAAGINRGAARLNRLEQRHPGTIRDFMTAVGSRTDKDAVNQAARHVTEAVLARRPPVFTLAWRGLKIYIAGLFKRRKT
ncbi:MAG: hypothetical protein ACLFUY_01400 [Desulfobacterales bacterium]